MASPANDTTVLHWAIALLAAAALGFDLLVFPLGVPTWALYLVPLVLCSLSSRPLTPLMGAATMSSLVVLGYVLKPAPPVRDLLVTAQINRLFGFATIWFVGVTGWRSIVTKIRLTEQNWVKSGLNGLSLQMQGVPTPDEVGRKVLSFLAEYLDAQVGAAYVCNDRGGLACCATFARGAELSRGDVVLLGEGLVGQAAVEGRVLAVDDLPDGYVRVTSGTGAARPRSLLLVPTRADGEVNGILELGFLAHPPRAAHAFLQEITGSAGSAFQAARYRKRQADLLEETQRQAEELQSQQEQVRAANEELQMGNEELEAQGRALKQVTADLERASRGETQMRKRFESLDRASLASSRLLARAGVAPMEELLQVIADQARIVADAEFVLLGIGDNPDRPFDPVVFSGMDPARIAAIGRHPGPRGLLGEAVRTGRAHRVRDLRRHPTSVGVPSGHPEMRSFLGVPIKFEGRSIGNLYLTNKRSAEEFSEEDEATIQLLAERAAIVMEIARLGESVRKATAQLEQASRYKSEFLANMSHELRTPLNSSLILAKLLADNREGNLSPEQVKYAQSISAAGNDLLALINDILDLSKIEAGKIDLNIEPVAIDRLMRNLKHRFEPLAAERKLELSITVDPSCPQTLETDLQRVQQILTNLLSNAVKFTEKGAIRLLAAPKDARRLAFTVEDTGIGIPAEQHEVIFDAFRQADGTTNRKFGGTGLGLSISRELAALLGGEIRVRSAPGEGSAFTVLIPLRAEAAVAGLPSSTPRTEVERRHPPEVAEVAKPFVDDDRASIMDPRRVVLMVEDDLAFARILRDLARELGLQCIIAGTAEEGLRLARECRPGAVVLDIGLPDQSGLTVLELLKRDPSTRHIPIHVVSAHDYRLVAREMGAIGYMLKPVEREHLVSTFRVLEERLARKVKALLIVEDDSVQREAITKLLAADDVRIVAVATANEALAQLRGATFDCVVLDLMMPDVSGFELLGRMSEDESCSLPPVIVYTARSLTIDEEQKLRRLSKSIVVKGARSPERLLEEVTLFLHQVDSELPPDKQRMLRVARERETTLAGRRVLLVEDDVRNIFALTAVLEPKGAAVDVARNGREALARLDHEPPVDLVLMDIMMPEMEGLEATREIRKRTGSTSLPIIALTAKAMPDDRQECLAAGANDYIAKPIDVEKLLSLVRVWMPK